MGFPPSRERGDDAGVGHRIGLPLSRILPWLLTVSALGVSVALQRQVGDVLLLVPAIVLAAWLCGLWGGLLATAIACAAAYYRADTVDFSATAALALSGVMISALGAALRRTSAHDEREFSDAMIESMPGVMYLYNEQGGFLRWNRNLERASGYSTEEIARLHPMDMTAEADRARVQAEIVNVFDAGDSSVEAKLISKDGTLTPYYFTGKRIVFKGAPCLVGVGIDMSQRDAAESRLRNSEASLAKAQRIAQMGSWELDITSGQLSWSDEIYRIFWIVPGPEPVTYERFIAHVHPDDREYVEYSRVLALRGEAPLNIEHRIVRADHQVRWVQQVREWYSDVPGEAGKITCTVLDITQRKQAQLQLQETMRTLEQAVVDR